MVKQNVETTTRPLPGHPGVTVSVTTYLTPDEEIQCSEDEESWGVCAEVSVKVGPDEFTADASVWDCRVSARSSHEDNRVYFLTLREEVADEAIENLLVKLQACADGADLLWASRRTQAARAILGDGPDFTPRRRERH